MKGDTMVYDLDRPFMSVRDAASARAEAALDGLTRAQAEAVLHRGSPQLILAGAGSGKTGVITRRIVHLIASGDAAPEEILGVTFTTKAAAEIARRVEAMLGEDAFTHVESDDAARGRRRLRISLHTFHAAALQILKRHAEAADLGDGFSILNRDDQARMVRKILAEIVGARSPGLITPEQVKIALADIEAVAGDPDRYEEHIGRATPVMRKLLTTYGVAKLRIAALDYTDLMVRSLDLLRHDDEVASQVRDQWRFVLVDEYQDTNRVQEAWLREIVGDGERLCVVGDDDQILYSWRGAEAQNILGFPDRYPGTRLVRLEENFRSVGNVLACANAVIAPAHQRNGKTLIPTRERGRKVAVRQFLEARHEAAWVARSIEADLRQGINPREIGVIARSSHALNLVEQALTLLRIPHLMSDGKRFQDRAEIRNALAWARLVANPSDSAAFERAAAAPRRGLGEVTIARIVAAFERGFGRDREGAGSRSRSDVITIARHFVSGGNLAAPQAKALAAMLDVLAEATRLYWRDAPASEIVGFLIEESGMRAQLEYAAQEAEADEDKETADQHMARLANLADLSRVAGDLDLDGFLDHMGIGVTETTGSDGVFVGTAHAAKGLEWRRVILIGWEDNLLPDWRALGPQAPGPYAALSHPLDEERRIAHVMVTRAQDILDITTTLERFGKPARPSRFLADIPADAAELWEMPAPARA